MFRKIVLTLMTIVLTTMTFAGVSSALAQHQDEPVVATLRNVRDYAPALRADGLSYAVDGGELFAGVPLAWRKVQVPAGVIVSAVAVDSRNPDHLYIGAANQIAVYRSQDGGTSWMQVVLNRQGAGSVTDLAVDGGQRLVYVGTDTDGLYRLLDVGSSLISGGHLKLDEPVVEIAADSTGAGLAFVRTPWNLYRAENGGLAWAKVENLLSAPTALAVADSRPARVYVGTADRGVLVSEDGRNWQLSNAGLSFTPGTRLFVDDIAVDPVRSQTVYVSTSLLFGSTTVHSTPQPVAMSLDGGMAWNAMGDGTQIAFTELLPVSGQPGALYALSQVSRSPLALGSAPAVSTSTEAVVTAGQVASAGQDAVETAAVPTTAPSRENRLAWAIAGLALLALIFAAVYDLAQRLGGTSWGKPTRPAPMGR